MQLSTLSSVVAAVVVHMEQVVLVVIDHQLQEKVLVVETVQRLR